MNQYAIRRWGVRQSWGMFVLGFVEWVGESKGAQAQVQGWGEPRLGEGTRVIHRPRCSMLMGPESTATFKSRSRARWRQIGVVPSGDQWLVAWGTRAVQCTCPEAGRRRVVLAILGAWGMAAGRACDETVARRSGGDLCAGLWGCGSRCSQGHDGVFGVSLACGRSLLAMAQAIGQSRAAIGINGVSILQTQLSKRERGMKPDALALRHASGPAHERRPWCTRAGVEKRPDPVHDFLDVTDQRPHREDRLHQQAFLPLTALTPCELGIPSESAPGRSRQCLRVFSSS